MVRAPISKHFYFFGKFDACWKALSMTVEEFPALTNNAAMASGRHQDRSVHMTSLLNLAPLVLEQRRLQAFDCDVTTSVHAEVPRMIYPTYTGTHISDMCPTRLDHQRRRRELLSTVSCIVGQSSVQVVLLHVDTDFRQPDLQTVNATEAVDFGRALVSHLAQQYGSDLTNQEELVGRLVPHKRNIVGSRVVYSCGSLREAMTLAAANDL